MKIEPFELRCPAELIAEVADRARLVDGSAYAVLVHDPFHSQRVRDVAELPCGSLIENELDAREILESLCDSWDGRSGHPPSELKVVTVVVRRGLCVWTDVEWRWSNVWRRVSTGLSGGDLITVTEHGWYDFMTNHADHRPALMTAVD